MMNHIWQSTIFAVAVAAFTLAFRGNRAGVRYWLWLAASLKFLLPFSPLIALGTRMHRVAVVPAAIAAERLAAPFPASIPPTYSWLPALWLCGFVTLVLLRLRAWLQFRAAVRAGKAMGPAVFGLLRPVVLAAARHRRPPQSAAARCNHGA
jgi:beta-lactamase regulating signal transducer with metallopeptidase domain